jgi:hypothetical protein
VPGALPKELPAWFAQLDTDRDAQVGLYECVARQVDEFIRLDQNNDGFLTVPEVLRSQGVTMIASAYGNSTGAGGPQMPGFGRDRNGGGGPPAATASGSMMPGFGRDRNGGGGPSGGNGERPMMPGWP